MDWLEDDGDAAYDAACDRAVWEYDEIVRKLKILGYLQSQFALWGKTFDLFRKKEHLIIGRVHQADIEFYAEMPCPEAYQLIKNHTKKYLGEIL